MAEDAAAAAAVVDKVSICDSDVQASPVTQRRRQGHVVKTHCGLGLECDHVMKTITHARRALATPLKKRRRKKRGVGLSGERLEVAVKHEHGCR